MHFPHTLGWYIKNTNILYNQEEQGSSEGSLIASHPVSLCDLYDKEQQNDFLYPKRKWDVT